MGDVARKLSSLSQMSDSVLDQTQETVPISRSEPEEGDGGRTVCRPPRVGWPDVAAWMVEDSCVTVDLRKCDEASHQWLVERYMEPEALGQISSEGESEDPTFRSSKSRSDLPGRKGKRGVRGAFSPSKRGARSRSALGRGEKSARNRNKRTSFLHMPFTPQSAEEAIVLVTDLIVKLRHWARKRVRGARHLG